VLEDLFASLSQRHQSGTLSFHLSAHGFGARFAADFLDHAVGLSGIPVIDSLTLTAPLLTIDEFQERVVPHVVHRLDGRANPRARRDHLEINRIRLAVLDEECQREDRADPGYGGSLPELWASAGALAMHWLGQTPPDTDESAETREPRLRLLALPQYARLLSQRDIDLRVEYLSREDRDLPEPRHWNLDTRACMLDRLLRDILGNPGSPLFIEAYGWP
jgi:hypothetical protein